MKRTTWSRFGIVLGVLALAAGFAWLARHSKKAGPLRLRVTVGRETTYLTAPLTKDGRVDYAAAWRAEHSNGVTPENNGAPLVYAAIGRDVQCFTNAERERLVLFEPPFTDFETWARGHEDCFPDMGTDSSPGRRLYEMATRSLDAGEDEDSAAPWLEEVGPHLDAVVRAMTMGRFFTPEATPFLEARTGSNPSVGPLDAGISQALAWRALKRTRRGDAAGACADLRAALHLATRLRALGNQDAFREAAGGERGLWWCARQLREVVASDADTESIRPLLEALRDGRDPAPPAERLAGLFQWSRITVLAAFDSALRSIEGECAKNGIVQNLSPFDPDRIARQINRRFDEFERALAAEATWPDRRRRLDDAFAGPRITRTDVAARAVRQAFGLRGGPHLDEIPWELFVSVAASPLRDAVAELLACTAEGDRALVELAALVFALENGRDPSSSDDLTPDLVDVPWRDRITGSRVTFRRDAHDRLVAQGPVVDFLEAIDLEREEPAPEKK